MKVIRGGILRDEFYFIICSTYVFLYFRTHISVFKFNRTAKFNSYSIFYFIVRSECVADLDCGRNEILLELRCFRFIINYNLSLAHQDRQPCNNKRNDSFHKLVELELIRIFSAGNAECV